MTDQHGASDVRGLIGRSLEDGRPVIWAFVNELPADAVRASLPWLTVVRWTYDGELHDGMPDDATKAAIFRLDEGLDPLEEAEASRHVYSRTGNGLREWVFHAASQAEFLAALNDALADHERYPIEIKFYEDVDWTDFRRLLRDFGETHAERMN